MGLLTDVIIATPQEASAVCAERGRRAGKWPCLEFKNLDNVKLAVLTDALELPEAAVALEGQDRLVFSGGNEGPWVFHLPDVMRDALAEVPVARIRDLAEHWHKTADLKRDGWTDESAVEAVEALRRLAALARVEGKPLLLWMCM